MCELRFLDFVNGRGAVLHEGTMAVSGMVVPWMDAASAVIALVCRLQASSGVGAETCCSRRGRP